MKHILLNICLILLVGYSMAIPRSSVNGHRSTPNAQRPTFNDLNRTAYYKAIKSDNKGLVDAQLAALNSAPASEKNAFLGAMTMRRAGIGGNPASKLKLFKQGHTMLEEAIKQDPNNAEYRFLRLIIQENAPGILGYKSDEEKDSAFIRKSYKSLPEELQKTIAEYNKKSKVLKLQVS